MALIIRIDVDRPYGKHPLPRHILSRLGSDFYFPKVPALGFLDELKRMLLVLNERRARAYVFFRRCTLPTASILKLMEDGKHEAGLHLEDSRSFETFLEEKERLERHLGRPVSALSKHGSGKEKYGSRHFAPYEPEKYQEWARRAQMKTLFGNLEDPTLEARRVDGLLFFPSAFWLEPDWRDTARFSEDWLAANAPRRDTVMLVHPENVWESPEITRSFTALATQLETRILP